MHAIGTLTKSGGDDTHYKMLAEIRTLALAIGWTELRYDTVSANRELILHSTGLSGTEDIFIGFRTYQNVGADYYNILAATMTGYISGNSFDTQPGIRSSGTPAHNNAITYFMNGDMGQIVCCMKVGTPVYTHMCAGKFTPYSRPGEWPSPLYVGGTFNGPEARRFSDTNYCFPYYGRESTGEYNIESYLWVRNQAGIWTRASHYPFHNGERGAAYSSSAYALASQGYEGGGPYRALVPAGTNYQPEPIVMYDMGPSGSNNWIGSVYGELRGIYQISGFNNGVENVMQIGGTPVDQTGLSVADAVDDILAAGGRAFVVLQDGTRNNWRNFIALEMT